MKFLGVNVISDSIASFSDFFGGASGTWSGFMSQRYWPNGHFG